MSENIKLSSLSCDEFTKKIASTEPAPGGGGAAAMTGAIAIALADMVCEFTIGKKKYADVEDRAKELQKRSLEIRARLIELIDEDAENFEPLSRAYSIPKDDQGRDEEMERCLRLAVKAPLEIFDLCAESVKILRELELIGSRIIVSDAYTGSSLAEAALESAAINVKVNTKLMKDREYADKADKHLEETMNELFSYINAQEE